MECPCVVEQHKEAGEEQESLKRNGNTFVRILEEETSKTGEDEVSDKNNIEVNELYGALGNKINKPLRRSTSLCREPK